MSEVHSPAVENDITFLKSGIYTGNQPFQIFLTVSIFKMSSSFFRTGMNLDYLKNHLTDDCQYL